MKPITKVFLVIGALVLCLLIWVFVFNPGGAAETSWNAVSTAVNTQYQNITGDSAAELLPDWATMTGNETDLDSAGGAF